jgi:hypothetical protein
MELGATAELIVPSIDIDQDVPDGNPDSVNVTVYDRDGIQHPGLFGSATYPVGHTPFTSCTSPDGQVNVTEVNIAVRV